jgi:hypothetical protein
MKGEIRPCPNGCQYEGPLKKNSGSCNDIHGDFKLVTDISKRTSAIEPKHKKPVLEKR